ncbi:metalloreductase STEAP4-like isoform X2 [Liolophura sinensis]|uniref:metalloreductase STEAP4-like isoform X2 n=1 Tax=Liolophura sinensis TaxID=3198878 RepID=UPI0031585B86
MRYPLCKPDDFSLGLNEDKMKPQNRPIKRVGIVGTGSFAAAVTNRLLCSGYDVIIGSRQPEMRNLLVDQCFCNFNITSVAECIEQCNIIILAIHAENYKDTLFSHRTLFSSKILVDVSNRLATTKSKDQSYAEYLSTLFPAARVVKAFNTIPACEMKRNAMRDNSRVLIAGSDMEAKDIVSRLATNMGFHPVDTGSLKAAREIENYNLRLFPEWRGAAFVTVAIFNLWLIYVILMIFAERRTESWNQLFLKVINKPLCLTAISLMGLAQIPGPLGTLVRASVGGSRKSPTWFKKWSSSKTQFGMFSWVLMGMHVLMSVLLTNNTYFPALYETLSDDRRCNVTKSSTKTVSEWMNWKGEAGLLLGLLATVAVCVVAFSTIPGIRNTLNWRERRFTQSTMNFAALFLAACHVVMTAIADWTSNVVWPFYHSTSFLCIMLPAAAILLGILTACPCVVNCVKKRTAGVRFYDVGKTCQCSTQSKGTSMTPMQSEITIFHERQRLSDRVKYKTLLEQE